MLRFFSCYPWNKVTSENFNKCVQTNGIEKQQQQSRTKTTKANQTKNQKQLTKPEKPTHTICKFKYFGFF